jgi:hypothetical protein
MATDDTPGTRCTAAAAPGSLLEDWMSAPTSASNCAASDPAVAHPARIHNYWLGGKDNLVPAGVARAAGGGAGADKVARSSSRSWVRVPVPPSQGQDTLMARRWPLRSFLELGAYSGAVPCARLHTRAVLWE